MILQSILLLLNLSNFIFVIQHKSLNLLENYKLDTIDLSLKLNLFYDK